MFFVAYNVGLKMQDIYYPLQVVISKAERGLWYDSNERVYDPNSWSIMFKVYAGKFARPIAKPFSGENPWSGKAWFTLRLPFMILPFLSIAYKKFGFYVGGKIFYVDKDEPWARLDEHDKLRLTISMTIRRTRWK